jgi:hypothetical protein
VEVGSYGSGSECPGSEILRGWKELTRHGYAAVYQDSRGGYGSEGDDHFCGDDASDGYHTWTGSPPSRGRTSTLVCRARWPGHQPRWRRPLSAAPA